MAQSLSKMYLHLVFSTKHREPTLANSFRSELHGYVANTLKAQGCIGININSVADHIHILFLMSRTKSVSEIVEDIKSSSSKWIKKQHGASPDFAWQAGYAVVSVSESVVNEVSRYIMNQQEHHKRVSFMDEFRRLLERHGIAYDERYVWD